MEVTISEMMFRIGLAFILSLAFGIERQLSKKPMGFGTFTFVATGSCLLALIAVTLSGSSPHPMLGGVLTGIGFLGAGAIIRYQEKVFGFTTAASIWAFAAFGLGVGVGLYEVAIFFYFLIVLIIIADHILERRGYGHYSRTITIVVSNLDKLKEIEKHIPIRDKATIINLNLEEKQYAFSFIFSGHKKKLDKLIDRLSKLSGIRCVRVE